MLTDQNSDPEKFNTDNETQSIIRKLKDSQKQNSEQIIGRNQYKTNKISKFQKFGYLADQVKLRQETRLSLNSDFENKQKLKKLKEKRRIWMLTLFFPIWLKNSIKRKYREYAEIIKKNIINNYETIMKNMVNLIIPEIKPTFKQCFKQKNWDWVNDVKRYNAIPKLNQITPFITKLLNSFNSALKVVPDEFTYLSCILATKGIPICNDLLYDFEISRLKFNIFNGIKEISQRQKAMIFSELLIVRILINEIILKYDSFAQFKLKKNRQNEYTSLILSSMLYQIYMDSTRFSVPVVQKDESNNVIQPKLSVCLKRYIKKNPNKESLYQSDEIIEGLFSKSDLMALFEQTELRIKIEQQILNIAQSYQYQAQKTFKEKYFIKEKLLNLNY